MLKHNSEPEQVTAEEKPQGLIGERTPKHPPLETQVQIWRPMHGDSQFFATADRRRTQKLAFGLIGLTSLLLVWDLFVLKSVGGSVAILLLYLLVTVLWAHQKRFIPTEADLKLIEDPQDPTEALVEVWIEVDGVVTGIDRGVLWHEGSELHFHGHRSSFRISRKDLSDIQQGLRRVIPGEVSVQTFQLNCLRVKHGSTSVRIGIKGLYIDSMSWRAKNPMGKIERIVGRFKRAYEPSLVTTLLPPLSLDPQLDSGTIRAQAVASGIVILAISLAASALPRSVNGPGLGLYVVPFSLVAMWFLLAPALRGAFVRRRIKARQNPSTGPLGRLQ